MLALRVYHSDIKLVPTNSLCKDMLRPTGPLSDSEPQPLQTENQPHIDDVNDDDDESTDYDDDALPQKQAHRLSAAVAFLRCFSRLSPSLHTRMRAPTPPRPTTQRVSSDARVFNDDGGPAGNTEGDTASLMPMQSKHGVSSDNDGNLNIVDSKDEVTKDLVSKGDWKM